MQYSYDRRKLGYADNIDDAILSVLPRGTKLAVIGGHGVWWSDVQPGSIIETLEPGYYEQPITMRSGHRVFKAVPTKAGAKVRLTITPGRYLITRWA